MYIEVCGNIASGKTTFASHGSKYGLNLLKEDFRLNPFFESFYKNPQSCAFEAEISFLLIHYHQLKLGLAGKQECQICDFSFALDRAYADVTLSGDELALFHRLGNLLERELGQPCLVVYLTCPVNILLDRIMARSRHEEVAITSQYLLSISNAIERRIKFISKILPVLEIDSSLVDFRNGLEDFEFFASFLAYLK